MINVSRAFKNAVYAPTRKTAATVQFDILDNTAYYDNTFTVPSEAAISRSWQLDNKIRQTSNRYATFEKDYFKLDGTFCIPPRSSDVVDNELGWWSSEIANAAGVFSTPLVITCSFTELHSSLGLSIVFDQMANEYAADFVIDVYDEDDEQIAQNIVVGNSSPLYVFEEGLNDYRKIILTITKWAKPYRRARVIELDFGIIKQYDGEKLIKVNLIEQMNVVGDTLPSNELKFTVDNSDKEFNILNPDGFYRYLNKNQEVSMSLGVEVAPDVFEYIGSSKFYLTDWQSDEGSLTTTFTARDILNNLESIDYVSISDTNLYDLAMDIMERSGVEFYFIDPALADIPTSGFKETLSARKALQCIGLAGKAAVFKDRSGYLNVRQFEALDARTTYLTYIGEPGLYVSPSTYMEIDNDYGMKSITFDNVYREPQIKLDKLINSLDVVVNNYAADEAGKEVLNTSVDIDGTLTVFFDYQDPIIASTSSITITGATSYSVLGSYDVGLRVQITASGSVGVRVTGTSLMTVKTTYTLSDPTITDGSPLKLDNPLINDPAHAYEIGKWILQEKALRAIYDVNWRQNPCLECGDIVLVEDSFGAKKQSRIIKQEYEFDGALRGKTTTKGGM